MRSSPRESRVENPIELGYHDDLKTLFLMNPASGRKRDPAAIERLIRESCESASLEHEVRSSTSKDELDNVIGAALADGFEVICAVGGDGTVSEIGRRLIGTSGVLAILPLGSGNGLARHLGISMNPASALRAMHSGRVAQIDTATMNGLSFLGVCGVGFDAVVAHAFASSGTRGLGTYARVAVSSFAGYAAEDYELIIDGRTYRETALLIVVANSSQYGNQAKIAPLASLQDGLLDVCVLHQAPVAATALVLQQLFTGTLHDSPFMTVLRGEKVELVRQVEGPAHLDGEPLSLGRKLLFSIRADSLNVLVPLGRNTVTM